MDNFTPINLTPDFEAKVQQFTKLMQTPEMVNYNANRIADIWKFIRTTY